MSDNTETPLGQLGDMDLKSVDVAKRARRRVRNRPDPPAELHDWAHKAEQRMYARPYPPNVALEPVGFDQEELTAPHSDAALWTLQLADAFGTRSQAVINLFLHNLQQFCGKGIWDEDARQFRMSEAEVSAMLALVNAHRPKNEREAMVTAQLVGLHLLSMKVTARAIQYPYDTRTVGNVAKLATATADLNRSLDEIKGRKRTARQTIRVKKETHIHAHKHEHHHGGGLAGKDGRPHERDNGPAAEIVDGRATVRSEEPLGQVVPLPSHARQGSVRQTRR